MRSTTEILSDIVRDVNAMKVKNDDDSSEQQAFGPFEGIQSREDYTCQIEWPNLDLLVKEADTALASLDKCDECGKLVDDVFGCPDGRELCRDCFEEV